LIKLTPQEILQKQLTEYIEEAIDLRFEFEVANEDTGPVELHRDLVQAQIILSKLEKLLSKAMRAKSKMDRRVASVKMVYQEKFDRAISNTNKRPTLGEYATGKEKVSEANLAAFTELRELSAEETTQSFAGEAVDIIRLHYYGLDKVRQDLRRRLDLQSADMRNS
jgi:hypothetical protein